ncbi:MAG: Lrp/AsnC family transcriptional regulator [Clostridia bacterium]|nr:Lrp/AsnC family transcriptional regulator [Oscillospiraceae bacterium]MBO4932623.1 Lrp/AsnC family transcriptional regulator [Clostridia bacterium]MBO5256220.1 Lrp/AsnC family transcriptional regulator [Clostridia bacterium]
MNDLLKLLENDARLSPESLALMLDKEVGDIKTMIEDYENAGVILGYQTIIDWDKTDVEETVSAIIEIKITPQREHGYDRVAQKIYNYPEVESVYLMSGGYDLSVSIKGKTMREVALFVAERLAPIDGVLSTATHFVLRKYKDNGVVYGVAPVDERGMMM